MKRFKQVLAVVLCVFMVAALFAGCKSGNDVASPAPSDNTAVSPAASEAAQPSEAASPAAVDPATFKGEVSLWHFNKDEAPKIEAAFKKAYPQVKFTMSLVPDKDSQYINKISAAVRAGSGVPDVYSAEATMVRRIITLPDGWADITDKAKDLTGDMYPYTLDVGTDSTGKLRALSHQITAGGFGYKRAVAKKYLGTDDPAQLTEMFSSQDKLIAAAKTLKEKSGGKVALFPSWDEMKQVAYGSRAAGWVVDGKFNIDQKILDLIDFSKTMRDNKYECGFDAWSTGWSSAIAADEQALLWAIPTWGVPYIINSNDKKAKDSGKWGICEAPGGFFWGGTWYGYYGKAKDPAAAWEFIKWFTADKEHLKAWAADTGDIPNSQSLITEGAASSDVNPIMGVNLYKFYQPFVSKINGKVLTEYDDTIQNAFTDIMKSYLAGKIKTKDDVVKQLKDKVKTNLKDITVE